MISVFFVRKFRNNLWLLGVLGLFLPILFVRIIFPSVFPSVFSLWKSFLFPVLFCSVIFIYGLRSFVSEKKILLKALGLFFILGYSCFAVSKIPQKVYSPLILKLEKPIILKAGDPLVDLRMNPAISEELLKREEKRLGLDQPVWKQFTLWFNGVLLDADFGVTQQGESVLRAIKAPLFNTIILNIFVLIFSWFISIILGVISAIKKNTFSDKIILTFSSLSLTVPSFLLGIFTLGIALNLGIKSIGGMTSVNFSELSLFGKFLDVLFHLFLPVLVLTFISVGMLIRQMRGNMLDVLNEDYIKAARAHGLPESFVFWRHAFPNAINPLITILGFEFAALVSGAALTEMIFGYPGIGALTLEAAQKMDVNLMMFNLLLGTSMLLIGNLMSDLLLNKLDPRTRAKNQS